MALRNVSNPAAIGYETPDGRAQVVWPRGSAHVFFGMRGQSGQWSTTAVVEPERFGFDPSDPRTVRLVAVGILESDDT